MRKGLNYECDTVMNGIDMHRTPMIDALEHFLFTISRFTEGFFSVPAHRRRCEAIDR